MSKIDTILFDWDGTLAQTLEVWLKTFKKAYASVGITLTDSQIGAQFGNLQAHKELGVKPEDEARYHQQLEGVYDKLNSVSLYEGAQNVLLQLRADGYKLGLVSTSNHRMILTALKKNGIEALFDVIVTAEDTVKHKPNPEPLFTALSRLESEAARTIFVGDSDKDTGAAINAGMNMLLFCPESHRIYYDLQALRESPSVIESFKSWTDFPFSKLS